MNSQIAKGSKGKGRRETVSDVPGKRTLNDRRRDIRVFVEVFSGGEEDLRGGSGDVSDSVVRFGFVVAVAVV